MISKINFNIIKFNEQELLSIFSCLQCMFQSWYLAVDTQLFFVAPIFIYSLWHWRRFGAIFTSAATFISLVIPSVITYKERLDPTLLFYAKYVKSSSLNVLSPSNLDWVLLFNWDLICRNYYFAENSRILPLIIILWALI